MIQLVFNFLDINKRKKHFLGQNLMLSNIHCMRNSLLLAKADTAPADTARADTARADTARADTARADSPS